MIGEIAPLRVSRCGAKAVGAGRRRLLPTRERRHVGSAMKFSMMFFSNSYPRESGHAYATIAELARYGDEHGFEAIWVPERHFHTLGGIFPNPAVTAAYLASITKTI